MRNDYYLELLSGIGIPFKAHPLTKAPDPAL